MHEEGQLFGNIGWEIHLFWLYNRQELAESTYFPASGKNPQIRRSAEVTNLSDQNWFGISTKVI